ncbi:hypothetical protein [Rhodovulum marinum]|uniref:HEAT repeat protein n=1 Tax=Rhodovulum marinum TaxID=320662 RepID=A0A4R2PVH2_9RHOB|nr:hypothetical protein [Rhodovulum marinum]TCP39098.1 hypothetical protein EV662_11424 [Rhodovulum marinum]
MILRAVLLVVFLLPGLPALAQAVAIRSGEHADFSRLVFEVPAGVSWSLGRGAEGYLLEFDDPDLDFTFAGVFDLIPRTRLTAIALDAPGRLSLGVAEDVHAEAFTLRPGLVVLDLRNGPAPADSPFEAPLQAQAPQQAEPRRTAQPPVPKVRLPMDAGRMRPAPVIGRFLPPTPPSATVAAPADPRVAAARSELAKQIGRAAAQGLLEPADIRRAREDDDPPPDPAPPETAEDDPGPEPALPGLADRPNMHVETSIDRGFGPQASGRTQSALGDPCFPDSYFDLSGWLGEDPPAALIAAGRSALLNMRDAPDPAGAQALVRSYLALGFGAEARAVIDTVALDSAPAPVWREMGAILDEGRAENPDLFDGQLSCPSRAALWATLARPDIPSTTEVDEAAVIRSFSELPLHLRRHLGPTLAERFLAAGDTAAATRVRNAVARAGEMTQSGDLTLVEARLDLSHGQIETAEARIDEVLAEGGLSSPQALVLRLETELDAGQAPAADALALAEALAFERRGTALGTQLLALSIRGHGANGNFQTAFGMLMHNGLESDGVLVSDLVRALARDGRDADLLREAFSGVLTRPDIAIADNARLAVADRLLTLGFPARAAEIVSDIPPRGTPQERQVRARLALAIGQPGQAMQYLSGLDSPQADILRAEAARALGDLATAARYYGAAGDTERQAALAWRDRNWQTVRTAGPDDQRGYADLREETPAGAFDPAAAPSLSGARSLLDGSSAMRARLADLLAPPANR